MLTSSKEKDLIQQVIDGEYQGTFLSTIVNLTIEHITKQQLAIPDVIFCGNCGNVIIPEKGKLICCNNNLKEDKVIRLARNALLREILSEKNIKEIFKQESKLCGKNNIKALAQIQKYKKELPKILLRLDSLISLANAGTDVKDEINELQKQKRTILYNIEVLTKNIENVKRIYSYSNLEEYIKAIRHSINSTDAAFYKALGNIKARITITDNEIELTSLYND